MLRSKYLIGHATYNGQTVRDSEGNPVLNADPIFTLDEWDRLQTALDNRKQNQTRTRQHAPMGGIVSCLICGKKMYHRNYRQKYRYYHCPDHKIMVDADEVEGILEETFLREYGNVPVTKRVYRPAEDHTIALNEAVRAVDELTELLGQSQSKTVAARLTGQLKALDERIAELEKLPAREAGWEEIQTGDTYGDLWKSSDKRQLLLDAGITLAITRTRKTNYLEYHLTQKIPPPE